MGGFLWTVGMVVFPQHAAAISTVYAASEAMKLLRNRGNIQREESVIETAEKAALEPVTLTWKNVSLKVKSKKKGQGTAEILKDCAGEAKPGRLMAIMGPSGAGKTSLLNALAGQVKGSSLSTLTGDLLCNGLRKDSESAQAYILQNPYFFSCLTVRETLQFAARARLSNRIDVEEREKIVENLIRKLGLAKCADSFVGNAKTPGISGGEKKRLGIACEMIGTPALIFIDEPTSGLDSFQAEQVVAALKTLTDEGHTVLCSIHQPRGSIFKMFDDVCLISEGQTMYCGPADEALPYFKELGFSCPDQVNPAEFLGDIISLDYTDPEKTLACKERLSIFAKSFHEKSASKIEAKVSGTGAGSSIHDSPRLSWWDQLKMLYERSLRQILRDKRTLFARIMPCISSAIMFGSIYFRITKVQSAISDRVGLLQVCVANIAMLSMTRTLNIFPPEQVLIDQERARHSYHVFPYFLGKVLAELPILSIPPLIFSSILYPMSGLDGGFKRLLGFLAVLTTESAAAGAIGLTIGALAPSTEVALALGPSVMLLFMLFGGFYVNAANVPLLLKWIPRVSIIRWCFGSLVINQFTGLEFEAVKPLDLTTGEQVIERLGYGDLNFGQTYFELFRITIFFYLSAYGFLKKRKPSFQKIATNEDVEIINQELNGGRITEFVEPNGTQQLEGGKVAGLVQDSAAAGAAEIAADPATVSVPATK